MYNFNIFPVEFSQQNLFKEIKNFFSYFSIYIRSISNNWNEVFNFKRKKFNVYDMREVFIRFCSVIM